MYPALQRKCSADVSLNSLKSVAQDEVTNYATLTVKEITFLLNSILNEEAVLLHGKTKIDTTLAQITTIGGSVAELISLKEEIGTYLKPDTSLEYSDLSKFLLNLENEIKTIEEAIEKTKQENDKLISELNKSLQLKEVTNDISKISCLFRKPAFHHYIKNY